MLRQAQHERKIENIFNRPFVRPEQPVEGLTKGLSAVC
jgi:hypothetical protein